MTDYNIKLVGLDLDGTVLHNDHTIGPRTAGAIRRANEQGCLVIPATGRPLRGVPRDFLSIPGVNWAVTANGATVTDLTGAHEPLHFWIPVENWFLAKKLTAHLNCVLDLFVDGCAYNNESLMEKAEEWAPPGMADYIRQSRRSVPDVTEFARTLTGVEKANLFFYDPSQRMEARRILKETGLFAVTSSAPNNLELNAAGVNKGRALLELAKIMGWQKQQVMACGDSDNDAAMLQAVGLGVAMGNASPEIKALAHYVTASNEEDGVARALEKFVLAD